MVGGIALLTFKGTGEFKNETIAARYWWNMSKVFKWARKLNASYGITAKNRYSLLGAPSAISYPEDGLRP
jgi:hypothetical protein